MVVDRKNKKALARSAIFGVGPLRNAADSSVVPTEFAAEPTKGLSPRRQIPYLNFSPFTKKTTEYSFELFLSIYRYFIFFSQVLNFTSVELNRFAKQAKLLKISFSKATVDMRFHAKKNTGCSNAPRDFPPRKKWYSPPPVGLSWDSLPPSPESVRTYVRRLTSQPNFLALFSNGALLAR